MGKSSIGSYYKERKRATGSLPVIIPVFAKDEFVDDKKVRLSLWDSACSSDYDEIRKVGYASADYFLLCYAMNDMKSLEHAYSIWLREGKEVVPDAQVIMVGTKYDVKTLGDHDVAPIRNLIKPRYYIETSSVSGENIEQLFKTIALLCIDPDKVPVPNCEEEKQEPEVKAKANPDTPPKSRVCLLI